MDAKQEFALKMMKLGRKGLLGPRYQGRSGGLRQGHQGSRRLGGKRSVRITAKILRQDHTNSNESRVAR
jgi:hypothetical protein